MSKLMWGLDVDGLGEMPDGATHVSGNCDEMGIAAWYKKEDGVWFFNFADGDGWEANDDNSDSIVEITDVCTGEVLYYPRNDIKDAALLDLMQGCQAVLHGYPDVLKDKAQAMRLIDVLQKWVQS